MDTTPIPEIQEAPRRRRPLLRLLKWFTVVVGSLLGLIVIFLLVVTLFFGNKVERLFLRELNKQLSTELTAADVKLNLFRSFPDATLTFYDIEIKESIPGSDSNLLEAQTLSFRFNVFDILRGSYDLKRLEASDGRLRLLTDRQGRVNYDIVKSTSTGDDSTASGFELNLQTITLDHMAVQYMDKSADQNIVLFVQSGRISGNLTESQTRLEGRLGVVVDNIEVGDAQYFSAKPATLNLTLDADFDNNRYTFSRSHIVIEDDRYALSGTISADAIDLSIEGEELNIASFLAMMPMENETMQDFSSEGDLSFQATIKGPLAEGSPAIDVTFALHEGTISHPKLGRELTNVDLAGSFKLGANVDWDNAELVLDPFRGEIGDDAFDCTVSISNLSQPKIALNLSSTIDLGDWSDVIATDYLHNFSGSLQCDDIRLTASFSEEGLSNITSEGTLVASDVGFDYLNKQVKDFHSTLHLANNQLHFDELELTVDNMPLKLEGTFSNGLQFLLGQVFSGFSDPLNMKVALVAESLDLDQLLYIEWPEEEPAEAEPTHSARPDHFRLLNMFSGTASLTAETFNFREFDAADVLAELTFSDGKIRFAPCSATTLDGRISISGEASRFDANSLQISGDARLRNIDITKLFKACENFGQETLVAENIHGDGNADIVFTTWWDTNMVFQPELLTGTADLDIQQGELIGFEPMKDLSAYVKVKELEHIVFDRLRNTVQIRDEVVVIPTMLIRSTALNLLMSGQHHFDNRIEYYFKINLLDVLAGKFRMGRSQISDIEDVNSGLINLYVAMTGTVDDPIIRTDKKLVKSKLNLEDFDPTLLPRDWGNGDTDTLEFIRWPGD